MSWDSLLRDCLLALQPRSVYAMEPAALELIANVLPEAAICPPGEMPPHPCDIALGIQSLTGLSAEEAQQLLNRTRLYCAPRLLLVEPITGILDADIFRSLGFTIRASDREHGINLYEYDLDTYKTVPDWLNARYWAHPERWKI